MSDFEFVTSLDGAKEELIQIRPLLDLGPVQFGIEVDDVLFPVFLSISSEHPDRLTVLYNGAVSRERCPDGVVFQRSSWRSEIPSTVVSFADPTLVLNEKMSIGWGQADGNLFAPEQYEKILVVLRDALNLPNAEKTLHYGSSAGGFQALATAAYDRKSRVLCNNPQTDFSKYSVLWATNRALKIHGYSNRAEYLSAENYGEIAWRVEVPKLYEKLAYIPQNIRILINSASKNDLEAQAEAFVTGITSISCEPSTRGYEIYYYFHPALGHNPLPKPTTIAEITSQLSQL